MRDLERHLDMLQLDALRAGEVVDPADAAHLTVCARGPAALADLSALAHGLRDLHAPAVQAAGSRDAHVLWLAGAHAARVRRHGWRRWVTSAGTWAAAAAALLALASSVFLARHGPRAPQPLARLAGVPPARTADADRTPLADLDGDGRITVLDAFVLARRLAAEGRGDEDSVEAMLASAVSIGSR